MGTNLNIEVETMTNTNLEDVDFAHNESKGLSINLNRTQEDGQTKAKTNFTTVGIQYADGGHDVARTTESTVGAGNVTE
jgi:hypothetical protein